MKKSNIFLFGALAIAAASCENDINFDAPMQEVPQGPVYEAGNIAAEAAGPIAQGKLDLNDYADALGVEVVSLGSVSEELGDAEVYFKFEIASNADFTGAKVLDVTMQGDKGMVSVEELNTDHIQLFGKSPSPKEVYYRIPIYVKVGGTDYRWGGIDHYAAESTYQEVCIDAGFSISSAYYFVGNLNDWQLDESLKFDHSAADVYDDPVFTITLTFNEGASYWKIAPQEAIDNQDWNLLYGPETDGDTSLEGMLVEGGGAGQVMDAGTYKLTINMETMEYSFAVLAYPTALAVRDQAYGWSGTTTQWLGAINEDGGYAGTAYIDPIYGFKLTDAATGDDWVDGKQWGMGEAGSLDGGDNITLFPDGSEITETALYWVSADLKALTYNVVQISTIGVVGGLNGWNQEEPIELQPTEDPCVWAAVVDLTGEWKIVINHSWDYNYGGAIDDLVPNAGNISGYEGSYNVAISFNGNYPTISLTEI